MIARLVYVFLVCCTWSLQVAQSQVTIYTENFNSYADGTMAGASWNVTQQGKCDGSADWSFGVRNNAFTVENVEGENCGCPTGTSGDNSNIAQFGSFDITDFCNVTVDFDISASGILECSDGGSEAPIHCPGIPGTGRDAFQIEAIVDGATTILFYYCGSNVIVDNRNAALNGTSLTIRAIGGTGAVGEIYTLDNLVVQGFETNGDITITADKTSPICEGESITLTAQSNGPWSWGTGENTKSITKTPSAGSITYAVTETIGCAVDRGFFTVVVFPAIQADAGNNMTICEGQSTTLSASGGTSYTWDDNSTNANRSVSPLTNTTYSVTVSNGICTDVDQVTVFVNDNPEVQTSPDRTICSGDNTTLTATGADNYSWSPSGSGASISVNPTSTTIYTVTGTSNGCTGTDNVTVFVNDLPTADISGTSAICEGESTTLNGSGGVTYEWSPSAGNVPSISVSPSSTTNYSLTVTDGNGCKDSDIFVLTVEENPVANAGADRDICINEDFTLSASGGTSYLWSHNNATTNEITLSLQSDATFTVTVSNGMCSDEDDVAVRVLDRPSADISGVLEICEGESTTLTAVGSGSYQWSTLSSAASIEVSPSSTQTYSLTLTNNGCDSIVSKTVVVKPTPNISAGNDVTICEGDEVTLTASGASTYEWEDGSTSETYSLIPTATQSVNLIGFENRCSSTTTVLITFQPALTTDIGEDLTVCFQDDVTLSAVGGDSFVWSNGATSSSIEVSVLKDTFYTVMATSGVCHARDTVQITAAALPIPEINGSLSYCPGSSTELSTNPSFMTIMWDVNGLISNGDRVTVSQNTDVVLTVTDELGCIGGTTVMIEENPSLSPTIEGKLTLCENETNMLEVSQDYDRYEWSTAENTKQISITDGGRYIVFVETNDGCSGRDTIDITAVSNPSFSIQGDDTYCKNDSTALSIPEYPSITWSEGSGNSNVFIDAPGLVSVTVMDENECVATEEITITELELPEVEIIGETIFCDGDSVLHTVMGDFVQSTWHTGSTMSSIYLDESQESSVLIEDQFGCRNSTSVLIEKKALPTPMIVAPASICEETTVKIYSESTHTSYTWNDVGGTDTLIISDGGIYTLEVENEDGCIASDMVDIATITPPFVEFTQDIELCNSFIESRLEPLKLSLDTVFSSASAQGNWSTSHANLDLSNLPEIDFEGVDPGQYELIYSTNDAIAPCMDIIQTLTVTVLDCNCPEILFTQVDTLCSIGEILDLNQIQSTDFEGSWQVINAPTSTLPSIDNNIFNADDQIPGSYEFQFRLVDGIAPLGCNENKSLILEVASHIDASLELLEPICNGDSANLQINLSGGNFYIVNLLHDDGQIINFNGIQDGHQFKLPMNGKTGLSFQSIESDIPSCGFQPTEDNYAFIPGELEFNIEVSQFGDFALSCHDAFDGQASVLINEGTAPFAYNWNDGSTTASIEGLDAGNYTVTVSDASGCIFQETVSLIAPPEKVIEIETIDPICGIGPGALQLSPISDYWDTDDWELYIDGTLLSQRNSSSLLSNIAVGTHSLEAVSALGCSEVHNFQIEDDSDKQVIISDITIPLGQSAILSPFINFDYDAISWHPTDYLSDSTTQNVTVTPLDETTYTVSLSYENGCVKEAMITVNVTKDRALMIPTGFSPNSDGTNDSFIIHASKAVSTVNSISIFDRWGEAVFQAQDVVPNEPLSWDWKFRNQDLPIGQYIWRASATFIDMEEVEFSGHFEIVK